MIYLHTSDASRLIVEDVHVVSTFSWFPLYDRLWLACHHDLKKESWRPVLRMTARANEVLRVHELIELLEASSEIKFGAAFLAIAQKNSI